MPDDQEGPAETSFVADELLWLRSIYRLVDPRSTQVTPESLDRALRGMDVAHLRFVRDLNSVILKDHLEVIGGCPMSYEDVSLHTDYIVIDSFLTELIGDAGTKPTAGTPEVSHSTHTSGTHTEINRGPTQIPVLRHEVETARRIKRRRRLRHYASKLWRKPSIRRPLKLLLVIFVPAAIEQSVERYAPEPVGSWARSVRRETVEWLVESFNHDTEPPDPWEFLELR